MFKLIKKGLYPICSECKVGILELQSTFRFPKGNIYWCDRCRAEFKKEEVELGFCGVDEQ